MKTFYLGLAALLATTAGAANAASIGLSTNYSVGFIKGQGMPEASGLTYNWDTNTLRVIGDEAHWGDFSTVDGSMVTYWDQLSTYKDPEGIAYIGNNKFVITQERTMELNELSYTGTGTVPWTREKDAPTFCVDACAKVSNQGLEGVTYDRHTGDYYAVKEVNPQGIYKLTGVDFAGNGTQETLFDPALLGFETISDISVLSNSDAFFGTAFGDNLLILSATSEKLLEITKAGEILGSYDLSGFDVGAIEGVTVDNDGNIYLAAEEVSFNTQLSSWEGGIIKLQRNVAAPAVPEPATWAMMMGGLGLVGASMRRRKVAVSFA